jgi:hypothetical protein
MNYPPGSHWTRRDGTTAKAGPKVAGPNRAARRSYPQIARRVAVDMRRELIARRFPVKFGYALRKFLGLGSWSNVRFSLGGVR